MKIMMSGRPNGRSCLSKAKKNDHSEVTLVVDCFRVQKDCMRKFTQRIACSNEKNNWRE